MAGFEELHLTAPLATALAELGWSPAAPAVREAAPPAARGTGLVLAAPPSAGYAVPALAGLLSGTRTGPDRILVLSPEPALDEWEAALAPLARAAGRTMHVTRGLTAAGRRLRAAPPDLVLASPGDALALVRRAALKLESVTRCVLAWPELAESAEALDLILPDLPREAARMVIAADPVRVAPLLERHAWRALTVDLSGAGATPAGVQFVVTPWRERGTAAFGLLDQLDPAAAAIWTLDRSGAALVQASGLTGDPRVQLISGEDACPAAGVVLAWDVPSLPRLQTLATQGTLVLLVPAYASPALARLVPGARPLRLRGPIEAAESEGARRRGEVARVVAGEDLSGALLAVAPLLERYDPASVAAALYRLWSRRPAAEPAGPAVAPAPVRLWVGIGRKDGVTPDDLVSALTREVRLDRSAIGRIEVREVYALVEVPAAEAERVANALSGTLIRRRKVLARVDRGEARPRSPRRAPPRR